MLFAIEIFGYNITFLETIVLVVAILGGAAGLVKAIRDIYTLGWSPAYAQFYDWILRRRTRKKMLSVFTTTLAEMQTTLGRIDGQLQTNGGSSVKDVVIEIDRKLEYIQAKDRNRDEVAGEAIFELDSAGNMTVTNCAFRELVNADDQELLYRKYVSRTHDADKPKLLDDLKAAIDNKMPLYSEVRFRTGPNKYVKVLLQGNPDVRHGGGLMGFFGTASKVIE